MASITSLDPVVLKNTYPQLPHGNVLVLGFGRDLQVESRYPTRVIMRHPSEIFNKTHIPKDVGAVLLHKRDLNDRDRRRIEQLLDEVGEERHRPTLALVESRPALFDQLEKLIGRSESSPAPVTAKSPPAPAPKPTPVPEPTPEPEANPDDGPKTFKELIEGERDRVLKMSTADATRLLLELQAGLPSSEPRVSKSAMYQRLAKIKHNAGVLPDHRRYIEGSNPAETRVMVDVKGMASTIEALITELRSESDRHITVLNRVLQTAKALQGQNVTLTIENENLRRAEARLHDLEQKIAQALKK